MLKTYKPIGIFSLMLGLCAQTFAKAPEHPSKHQAPPAQHHGKSSIQDKLKELKERIEKLKQDKK